MEVLLGSRAASLAPLTHSSIANLSPPTGPPTSPSPGPAAARCFPLRSSSPPRRGALPGPRGPGQAGSGAAASRESPPGAGAARPLFRTRAAGRVCSSGGARRRRRGRRSRGRGAPYSRRPRPAPAPPRAARAPARAGRFQPLPSSRPRRCPPPAREGGRWVGAEKVNEGGGGGCERLTRGARAPPASPARRLHGRAARFGGQAPDRVSGSGLRSARTPAPARRALGTGAPLSGPRARAPRRKGVVYFVLPGRCPGNSVRPRPGRFSRGCVCGRDPFGGPRGQSPTEPRAFVCHPRGLSGGGGWGRKAVETRPRPPALVADLPGSRPRSSLVTLHPARHPAPPSALPSPQKEGEQVPGPRRRLGAAVSGGLCRGHCPGGSPDRCSPAPAGFSGLPCTGHRAQAGRAGPASGTPASEYSRGSHPGWRGLAPAQTFAGSVFHPHTSRVWIACHVHILLAERVTSFIQEKQACSLTGS